MEEALPATYGLAGRDHYGSVFQCIGSHKSHLIRLAGQADKILSNSNFTARITRKYFPSIGCRATTVYPGINIQAYESPIEETDADIVEVAS